MHAWYVSYCRECNNLESFAAGSLYSTPALQLMSRVYQCCCGQRAEKPAAVMGPQLRARQLWSMRGLWNIHGTMRYATSRLSSYTSSYLYPVPFTLSRWRCSCIPKSAKEAVGCDACGRQSCSCTTHMAHTAPLADQGRLSFSRPEQLTHDVGW